MFAKNGPTFLELIRQALASTRDGYDLLAPKFDTTPFRTPDAVLKPAVDAIGPVDSALDVCCGTGAGLTFLKPLCRSRLVGIDFSPGMLSQAKANVAAASGAAAVEFVEGDALAMPFREEFDVATCFGALGHILPKDKRIFVRNVRNALKPGGRFVFVTGYSPPFFSLTALVARGFNLVMRVRNALIKPPFIMYYLTFLLPGVEALLREEGFSVEVRTQFFPDPLRRICLVVATRVDK